MKAPHDLMNVDCYNSVWENITSKSPPMKCASGEDWICLRSVSKVLRVSLNKASTLRWLKYDRSS